MTTLTIAAQDSATMLWREIKHSIRLLRLLIVSAVVVPLETKDSKALLAR